LTRLLTFIGVLPSLGVTISADDNLLVRMSRVCQVWRSIQLLQLNEQLQEACVKLCSRMNFPRTHALQSPCLCCVSVITALFILAKAKHITRYEKYGHGKYWLNLASTVATRSGML
jgi:hypothetical protein